MKYLTRFSTKNEYDESAINFKDVNVSAIKDTNEIKYFKEELSTYFTITFNSSVSDPANITLSGDESYKDELLSKFRRCLCKSTGDNQMSICYLDNNNSNFHEDGTPSILTGEEGDVMVYFPGFFYKGETIDETHYSFNFSKEKIDDTWKEAKPSLVGAYKAYSLDDKLYSRSGVDSTAGVSMANFSTQARNRGAGYHLIDYQQHCIIAWMFYSRYLTRDSQGICGTGKNAYTGLNCGSTNSLGITDTTTSNATSDSNLHVNFLGLEGAWGYKYEWIEGIHTHSGDNKVNVYDKGDYHDQPFSSVVSSTKRQFNALNDSDCIKEIYSGEYMDMLVKYVSGASSSTYFCDYGSSYSISSSVFWRSYYSGSTNGGVSFLWGDIPSSFTGVTSGSRLAFDGDITEVKNVGEFKNI